MVRRVVLVHGYSDRGESFLPWRDILVNHGFDTTVINVCSYETLTNEITIKDIAEAFDRALSVNGFAEDDEFDAIVHSTGMLVLRCWLTAYGREGRRGRLKHLIGLAPTSFGSPLARMGRSGIGAIFKGRKELGPDFLESGDLILDALELGSPFTWNLAHKDLIGEEAYYDMSPDTPYVFTLCGKGNWMSWRLGGAGTDGVARWAGCALNTKKINIDLTASTANLPPEERASWEQRSNIRIPVIVVDGVDHGSIMSKPGDFTRLEDLVVSALRVSDEQQYRDWYRIATEYRDEAQADKWQQIIVRVVDERGDGISDYHIQLLGGAAGDRVERFETKVNSYSKDASYRVFHFNPDDVKDGVGSKLLMQVRVSSGTSMVAYQAAGAIPPFELVGRSGTSEGTVDLSHLIEQGNLKLFYPWTTTLMEIKFNREPTPFDQTKEAPVCRFIETDS